MLPSLRPRITRLMQSDVASVAPAESRAAQFALELLNDLVASDTRSSVWDAQVELLTDFVKSGGRQKATDQLDALNRDLGDSRSQFFFCHQDASRPEADFAERAQRVRRSPGFVRHFKRVSAPIRTQRSHGTA